MPILANRVSTPNGTDLIGSGPLVPAGAVKSIRWNWRLLPFAIVRVHEVACLLFAEGARRFDQSPPFYGAEQVSESARRMSASRRRPYRMFTYALSKICFGRTTVRAKLRLRIDSLAKMRDQKHYNNQHLQRSWRVSRSPDLELALSNLNFQRAETDHFILPRGISSHIFNGCRTRWDVTFVRSVRMASFVWYSSSSV
jgi:hypothetical protein